MPNIIILRRMFVFLAAVCLSAAFFAGCGGAPEGQEDYEKGLAAYEAGDYTTAIAHFTTAAALKHPGAQCYLGICYQEGKGVTKDWSEAATWYHAAADQEDAEAEYRLALCYLYAIGVKYDAGRFVLWMKKAAEHGHVRAQAEYGVNGHDQKMLRKAAKKGDPFAQNYLADDLYDSEKEAKDEWYRKAAEGFRKAAEQGDARAAKELGGMYEDGRGVTKNPAEAEKWYRKAADLYRVAAEQGDSEAQMYLGLLYYDGKGMEKDEVEAFKWYLKAAEQGLMWGQLFVGYGYALGHGVDEDKAEAVKWFRLAADQGDEKAKEYVIKLGAE